MARAKSGWVCQQCGYQSTGYLGRCTECGAWGSFVEETTRDDASGRRGRLPLAGTGGPVPLTSLAVAGEARLLTGLRELDDVLGGGLVPGSVVLLAGDPGIGKSTLLLQTAHQLSLSSEVLYFAGEESAQQVRLRSSRLGIEEGNIWVDCEQNVLEIKKHLEQSQAKVAIVDSIQTVYHPDLTSAPGSVSQVRESAAVLINSAKCRDTTMILVGHVTKDGAIAGPRVLEHMVDVVLHFHGDQTQQLRLLRSHKNRFGSTQEMGVFTIGGKGLVEVSNPSSFFLRGRLDKQGRQQAPSGTAVMAGGEGSRSLLLEVEALVGATAYAAARRVCNGWDLNRLLQIIAVLEKKAGLSLSKLDVYVNIVGGIELSDPAGDLGVAVSIATSYLDRSLDPSLVFIGEIGLTGEVRPVTAIERRLREVQRMGFRRAVVPKTNLPVAAMDGLEIIGIEYLVDCLKIVMPGQKLKGDTSPPAKPVAHQDGKPLQIASFTETPAL